jgi:hypothetical protein
MMMVEALGDTHHLALAFAFSFVQGTLLLESTSPAAALSSFWLALW